nr:unnamed protein product [Spirometra erinaceieuropaei]
MSFGQRSLACRVDVLRKLETGIPEVVATDKEPRHFTVAKLTEVGLANINRIQLWWSTVTSKILTMYKLPHLGMQKLWVDALVLLIKQAIRLPQKTTFWDEELGSAQQSHPGNRLDRRAKSGEGIRVCISSHGNSASLA